MISRENKFIPEADFEKSDFTELISAIRQLDEPEFSAESERELFEKIAKINLKKPFILRLKEFTQNRSSFNRTVPAFATLVIAFLIFLAFPGKKVLLQEEYLNKIKQYFQVIENYQTFTDGPEETIKIYEKDTNGDGSYDLILYDLNSDGKMDYITIDFNHDNYTDVLAIDTNNDGKMDYFEFDVNFDSDFDYAGKDTTGNEIANRFFIL